MASAFMGEIVILRGDPRGYPEGTAPDGAVT